VLPITKTGGKDSMDILIPYGLKQGDGCYTQEGSPVTNFIIVGLRKIVGVDGKWVKYTFIVKVESDEYSVIVSPEEIRGKRFLRELPVWMEDEKKFYNLLYPAIIKKKFSEIEKLYQTDCGGLRDVNGKKMMVFSNCALSGAGFREDVYSSDSIAYFPKEAVLDKESIKNTVEKLFREYSRNPKVYYPLFFINVLSITTPCFQMIGESESQGITLWLGGASGSGKTELAKTVGVYPFDKSRVNRKPYTSATERRKNVLDRLTHSSGFPYLYDDVKKETTRERTSSVTIKTDDVLRSIFQTKLTDSGNRQSTSVWIDLCGIITGEYQNTKESQNARLIYCKVDGFLKEKRNSETLRTLQKNPLWLTSVCGGYIQWILNKLDESSFLKYLEGELRELRNRDNPYEGIGNAERLFESRNALKMAALLTGMFFKDVGMPENFIQHFENNAAQGIQAACDSTFYLLDGRKMVILKILERVFSVCHIREAAYAQYPPRSRKWNYCQEHFWLRKEDDLLLIENYKKSLMKGNCEHDEYDDGPCWLIQEKRLEFLFRKEVEKLLQENMISSDIADELKKDWLLQLRKMQ